ncbi:hypothetical protein ABEF95_015080 [Exophiala dermatitidis]
MTAIPSFTFQDLDPSHLDDKMDVASSPFRQADDLDVDLDSVHEPSIIESLHDDMVDDAVEQGEAASDLMQDENQAPLPDDDMIDDEGPTVGGDNRDEDFNMDAFPEEARVDEDEDILYEEEEDIDLVAEQVEEAVEATARHEAQEFHEVEEEVILDDVEEEPDKQNQDDLATNQPAAETAPDVSGNFDNAEQESANAHHDAAEKHGEAEAPREAHDIGDSSLEQDKQTEENVASNSAEVSAEVQVLDTSGEQHDSGHVEENAELAANPQTGFAQDENNPTPETQQHQDEAHGSTETQETTSRAVHPVTLVYLEEEMSLFPPMIGDDSSMYFLADSSLAFAPLDKLLAACRELLTGTLDHHDELVLDITSLGLHVCEDSKYASQITLAQILDVYLQLCRNDVGQEIRPLYCYLSSRVSLASQYAYLVSSSQEGRTFSEVVADHVDTPEPEGESTEATDYKDEQEDYGNQEVPGADQGAEDGSVTQAVTAEPEVDHRSDNGAATEEGGELEGTAAEVTGEAINASVSEEFPHDPVELGDLPEGSHQQGTEQEAADDNARQYQDEEGPTDEHAHRPEASPGGQEVHAEDPDRLDPYEQETNSSHTVEAEVAEVDTTAVVGDDAELGAHETFEDPDEEAEDLFEHDKGAEEANAEDFDAYGDDEIFHQEAPDQPVTDDGVTSREDVQLSTVEVTEEQHLATDDASHTANGGTEPVPNGHRATSPDGTLEVHSPPVTPSKANPAKRKVEDDDELDLLELDTPEPKRRRPS